MEIDYPEGRSFGAQERRAIEAYASEAGEAAAIALSWLDKAYGPMEQEVLDPVSPA